MREGEEKRKKKNDKTFLFHFRSLQEKGERRRKDEKKGGKERMGNSLASLWRPRKGGGKEKEGTPSTRAVINRSTGKSSTLTMKISHLCFLFITREKKEKGKGSSWRF